MKRIQGKNVFGFVTFCIQGSQPELFFQHCQRLRITVWDIEQIDKESFSATVSWYNRNKIIQISKDLSYHLTMEQPKGVLPVLIQKGIRKELWIALVLSVMLIFVSINIVWKLEVTGVSKEMDVKIRHELETAGLYPGAWGYKLENLDLLQQRLLTTIPDLLYIGIYKQGTTYHVDAVEKLKENKEQKEASHQLTATKDGIIDKMYITSGVPQVQVQDFVKKGDVLITGWIEKESTEEEEEGESTWIGAEGKVYANTWYEVSITVPRYSFSEEITGNKQYKYGIKFGSIQLPVWGFWNKTFEAYFTEKENIPIQLFSKELPISFWKEVIYDKSTLSRKYNDKEVRKIAIDSVHRELRRELGQDAEILDYNVLHETARNGKVNMNLYISVLEDIAKEHYNK